MYHCGTLFSHTFETFSEFFKCIGGEQVSFVTEMKNASEITAAAHKIELS